VDAFLLTGFSRHGANDNSARRVFNATRKNPLAARKLRATIRHFVCRIGGENIFQFRSGADLSADGVMSGEL
jgi:hypothetical protein